MVVIHGEMRFLEQALSCPAHGLESPLAPNLQMKRRSSTALYYDDFDRISCQFLRNDNAANESLIKPLSLAECEHLVRTYHCRKSGRYLYQYMGLMGSERALLRT
jgi:hypothetical protein